MLRKSVTKIGAILDASVVLNIHREGLALADTLSSLSAALEEAESAGYKTEVLIVADNSDQGTLRVLKHFKHPHRLLEVSFGNLSNARNLGFSLARGAMAGTLDGDDLVSQNWLVNSLKLAGKSFGSVIFRPERVELFRKDFSSPITSWRQQPARGLVTPYLFENPYTSLLICDRAILMKYPLREIDLCKSEGLEDWTFNLETLRDEIPNLIAPETTHYVRLKRSSYGQAQSKLFLGPHFRYLFK